MMASQTKYDSERRRTLNGKVGLYIPQGLVEKKRQRFLRNGKVMHRAELIRDHEYDIVYRYQWEYRGLVEYYAMAQNLSHLSLLRWTMETSLLKTLANKFRTTVSKTQRRLRNTWKTPYGPRHCLKVIVPREGKKPLMAVFGGLSLSRRPNTAIQDQVLLPFIHTRSMVVERLLRDTCEVCGAIGNVEIHHIRRLTDLKKPGQKEKPLWMQIMATRQRKTLVVCRTCHMNIQYNRPKSRT
jgi:hypothetical protein